MEVSILSKKYDKIVELSKNKSKITENKVLKTIDEMRANNEKITYYSVYKSANVSKSFVYNNEKTRELIEKLRGNNVKVKQTDNSKDIIIEAQNKKINELNRKINEIKKDETWEEKYYKTKKENTELKEQLKKLYAEIY